MTNKKYILGISAFYHDSAAVLLENNSIIAAVQEERFSRVKHDPSFPKNAIKFCLDFGAVEPEELDHIVFYEKPFLKFERLLETYYINSPKGLISFLSFAPLWMKEKLFLKKVIRDNLRPFYHERKPKKLKILFSEHHLSHAASAFYPSPFREAAILTVDGVGEWATAAIMKGEGSKIFPVKELLFPHSVGLLYSSFTYFLGFKVNSGEYKLMGLSPYGDKDSSEVIEYIDKIKSEMVDIKDDGSIFLNMDYFKFATGKKMINEKRWFSLFGFGRRESESGIERKHCDLALAIQTVLSEIVVKMADHARKLTGSDNLCLAGGVALNCVTNSKLKVETGFRNIWVQPAAGDAGGALGAALSCYYNCDGGIREVNEKKDSMQGSLLGPKFGDEQIRKILKRAGAKYQLFDDIDELCNITASYLSEGNVVGWFQGRMEWGPRALGNRSILADPRNAEMQKTLNLKIKFRESFRPFAPSVILEDCDEYFEGISESPYMLFISDVKKSRRIKESGTGHDSSPIERVDIPRSDIPAVTHVDFTSRLQTVDRDSNIRYRKLLEAFKKKTGFGILVNTSFNVRGEPIVCTPEEAFNCFMDTGMDYLVMGKYILRKSDQKQERKRKVKRKFLKD